jgi:hypothetical protein
MKFISNQGSLTEGEGLVELTSLYLIRSAPFALKIMFIFLTKQATLMRRSAVLSLSPLVRIPCI